MSLYNSIIEDFNHLFLEILFQEKEYDWNHHLIPSIRGKPSVLYRGFKYNWHRDNKNSTVCICRETVNDKQCSSTFNINNDGKGKAWNKHTPEPFKPVECDIILINIEIQRLISTNPTTSIKNIYDQKEIELSIKYGSKLVAKHWPNIQKDSGLFKERTS